MFTVKISKIRGFAVFYGQRKLVNFASLDYQVGHGFTTKHMNEYRFQEIADTPPQKHDPGYGKVIASRGDLAVRFDGGVYSIWFGPRLITATEDRDHAESFVDALKKL